ncbi:pilus assembly protein [Arthrobacter sp. Sa2BUA2]|uniref:Pilus assembly protein n=1 Tax=Arthrobacter pullicola TaxID=2762224 RepID=A0ABR8YJX6_9MICC|nr:pilus assembly protein [Arthrobacter pullicola]
MLQPALHRSARGAGPSQSPEELGAVTAELAVALPAVVVLLAGLLTGAAAGVTQLRLEEAASAAARQVMRGEAAAAGDTVARLAGPRAGLELRTEGEWVTVQVESPLSAPLLEHLPITLTAQAVALPEQPP